MDDIVAHVEKHIGPVHMTFFEIVRGDPPIDALHVKSGRSHPYEVLVTSGMSARPMTVPEDTLEAYFAELVAILPKGWPLANSDLKDERNYWPIRMLKTIARYPHEKGTYLAWDHIVLNGESAALAKPYAENTAFCGAMLVPPSQFKDEAWWSQRSDGHLIAFLTVVPLLLDELIYASEHGMEAFFDIFGDRDITLEIDPPRPSVMA